MALRVEAGFAVLTSATQVEPDTVEIDGTLIGYHGWSCHEAAHRLFNEDDAMPFVEMGLHALFKGHRRG